MDWKDVRPKPTRTQKLRWILYCQLLKVHHETACWDAGSGSLTSDIIDLKVYGECQWLACIWSISKILENENARLGTRTPVLSLTRALLTIWATDHSLIQIIRQYYIQKLIRSIQKNKKKCVLDLNRPVGDCHASSSSFIRRLRLGPIVTVFVCHYSTCKQKKRNTRMINSWWGHRLIGLNLLSIMVPLVGPNFGYFKKPQFWA